MARLTTMPFLKPATWVVSVVVKPFIKPPVCFFVTLNMRGLSSLRGVRFVIRFRLRGLLPNVAINTPISSLPVWLSYYKKTATALTDSDRFMELETYWVVSGRPLLATACGSNRTPGSGRCGAQPLAVGSSCLPHADASRGLRLSYGACFTSHIVHLVFKSVLLSGMRCRG